MTLIRWNPVFPSSRFDPFFNTFFKRFYDDAEGERTITPNADIRETKDDVVLSLELPGLSKEEVNLSVENGILTISGERKAAHDEKDQYHLQECCYGKFTRRFTLGEEIDAEKISAKMDKGILEVTLGRKEAVKPKKIDVKIH